MDEFHGVNSMNPDKSLYNRKEVSAHLSDKKELVFTYFLNPLNKIIYI